MKVYNSIIKDLVDAIPAEKSISADVKIRIYLYRIPGTGTNLIQSWLQMCNHGDV